MSRSFFPPDVRYVADHAKRAMSTFPACTGFYYGVDYRSGARMYLLKLLLMPWAAGGRGVLHARAAGWHWVAVTFGAVGLHASTLLSR
jgi:hypothetical protein